MGKRSRLLWWALRRLWRHLSRMQVRVLQDLNGLLRHWLDGLVWRWLTLGLWYSRLFKMLRLRPLQDLWCTSERKVLRRRTSGWESDILGWSSRLRHAWRRTALSLLTHRGFNLFQAHHLPGSRRSLTLHRSRLRSLLRRQTPQACIGLELRDVLRFGIAFVAAASWPGALDGRAASKRLAGIVQRLLLKQCVPCLGCLTREVKVLSD